MKLNRQNLIPEKLREFFLPEGRQNLILIVIAMISAAAIARFYGFSTANITTLPLAILIVPLFKSAIRVDHKPSIIAGAVCGLFFSLTHLIIKYEWLTLQEKHAGLYAFEFTLGFTAFYVALCIVLINRLRGIRLNSPGETPPIRRRLAVFFGAAAVMFLCWLPYYLLAYPCVITSDSIDQLNQAVKDRPLSDHHPAAHTFIIRLCYQFGYALFHDETKAVATFTVIQMLVMALAFSYLVVTLYRFRVKKLLIFCTAACYALLAYHGTYSVTMWKDVPFAFFVLTFAVTLWRILIHDLCCEQKTPVFETVMLFLTGCGMCLFRSNGLVAYLAVLIFLMIYCIRKRKIRLAAVACTALVLSLIVKGPVYGALNVKPPEPIEGLGIPQQMIGRVLANERPLTQEQEQLISGVADIHGIREHYIPNSADGIKVYIWKNGNEQFVAEHKAEFFLLWLDLGLKYPSDYLIAYVYSTNGYWYPDVRNWIYGDEFHSDNFETLSHKDLLSEDQALALRNWRSNFTEYYFWGLLWSIAAMFWLTLFMAGTAFAHCKKQMLLLYLPVICVWGTLMIAAPVYAEFRYTYSIFCCAPLLCMIPFVNHEGLILPVKATVPAEPAKPESDSQTAENKEEKPAVKGNQKKQKKKKSK